MAAATQRRLVLQPVVPYTYDTRYNVWAPIDTELLRALVFGAKALHEARTDVAVASGSTTSTQADIWTSGENLVVKYITVEAPTGVTVTSVTLNVDGRTFTITQLGDLEANYGAKIYGSTIQATVTLASAVTADTTLTIVVRGFNGERIQVPRA